MSACFKGLKLRNKTPLASFLAFFAWSNNYSISTTYMSKMCILVFCDKSDVFSYLPNSLLKQKIIVDFVDAGELMALGSDSINISGNCIQVLHD